MKQNTSGKPAYIKCPHCGAEYHPSEIYMPGDLIGKPSEIIKDPLGKILYVGYEEEEEPALVQHFSCDECGKAFVVEAVVSYKTIKEEEELDFGSKAVSLLDD